MLFNERAAEFCVGVWIAKALTPTMANATSIPATTRFVIPAKCLFICHDGVPAGRNVKRKRMERILTRAKRWEASYFGASEVTIASKQTSSRSGSHNG